MDPYYPSQSGQQGHYRHSLSSTTDPSAHYQAPHGAGYAPPSAPYPHATSPYAAYPQATSSHMAAPPSSDTRGGYGGQPLRTLPFTHAHAAGMPPPPPPMHAHGAYAGLHPHAREPYAHQFNAQAGYAQGAAHHETRYIPTPAQTMQSYHTRPAGGAPLTPPPQSSPSPGVERYACDQCDRTFSRPHDRKRHYESQHLQTSHSCQYCRKEFSRADSLKRHLDNGCDKMPGA